MTQSWHWWRDTEKLRILKMLRVVVINIIVALCVGTRARFEPRTYAKGLVSRPRHVVGDAFTRGGGDNAASFPSACSQDCCNFAIFPQDKGLLISRPERAALLFGTLRDRINAALNSRLRDYPNYYGWDLIQVKRAGQWVVDRLESIYGWKENSKFS